MRILRAIKYLYDTESYMVRKSYELTVWLTLFLFAYELFSSPWMYALYLPIVIYYGPIMWRGFKWYDASFKSELEEAKVRAFEEILEKARVEREESMALLSEVRSYVARRDWDGARCKTWQMGDDEIKDVALGYIQDHVEVYARWRFDCFSCGKELPCSKGMPPCGYCGSREGMYTGPHYPPKRAYTECALCRKRTDYDDLEEVCSNCNTSNKWKYGTDMSAHKMGRMIGYL